LTGTSKAISWIPNGSYVRRLNAEDVVMTTISTPWIPFVLHVPLTTTANITGTNFIFTTPTYYTTGNIAVFISSNQAASCTVTWDTAPNTADISPLGTSFFFGLSGSDGTKTLYFNCSTGAESSAFTVSSLYLDTNWPTTPALTYPTNGGSVSGAFALTWNAASDGVGVGLSGYDYYISTTSGFASLSKSWTITGTSVNITNFELGTSGTYYRYVLAKDRFGNSGIASPVQSFSYSGIFNYTPTSFSFGSVSDAKIKTTYKSSLATIAWLSTGAYSLASVDKGVLYISGVMVGSTWYVRNGDTVGVEIISSSSYETRIRSILTIENFSTSFSVTTQTEASAADSTDSTLSSVEKLQVATIFLTLKELYTLIIFYH
jgi:hypothetical protein